MTLRMAQWSILMLLVGTAAWAQCPPHPRLIVNADRIAELRALTHPQNPDTLNWTEREKVSVLAFRSIVNRAHHLRGLGYRNSEWFHQGEQFNGLITLCMAHLLTQAAPESTTVFSAYITSLLDNWMIETPVYPLGAGDPNQAESNELGIGGLIAGWSLALDWLYPALDQGHRESYVAALQALRANVLWGDAEFWYDNNHCAIGWGGIGLGDLVLETHVFGNDEVARSADLTVAAASVRKYLDYGFPGNGAGTEGDWYINYALHVALPFALAADRLTHLPPSQRVDVSTQRAVQQAGTWWLYQQEPDSPYIGSPLNNTFIWGAQLGWVPEEGLNPAGWRAWPWLLAFGSVDRPSAAKHLFWTHYHPADVDIALRKPFDPDTDANDCAWLLFSRRGAGMEQSECAPRLNAVPILLGWPETDESGAFIGPDELPSGMAFPGQGLAVFRSSLHDLDAGGEINSDPLGLRILFTCRNTATWNPEGHHYGQSQLDMNQFTVDWKGEHLFWDSGYERYGDLTAQTHNIHTVYVQGAWHDFYSQTSTEGHFLRSLFGVGEGPSMAAGDNTRAWNSVSPPVTRIDRSQRHFMVMPREGVQPPYIIFHDDIDYAGSATGMAKWYWHSNSGQANAFSIDYVHHAASLHEGEAAATATMLSPPGTIISQAIYDPPDHGVPAHDRLTVLTGVRPNADLVVLVELHDAAANPSLVANALAAPTGCFAYEIADGTRTDLVVFRQAGQYGAVSIVIGGRTLTTDAQQTVVRFQGPDLAWQNIVSGMLIQGSRIWYDDQLVAGLSSPGFWGDLVFSGEEVSVTAQTPTYFVGPVIPLNARINGVQQQSIQMWNVPHPLRCLFPPSVGRSPVNGGINPELQYSVVATLRNWADAPLAGWPTWKVSMDIAGCQNPRSGLIPFLPADMQGHVTWTSGLDAGGSCEIPGGRVVRLNVDYDNSGLHLLHSYPSITSPDEDGDGTISTADSLVFNQAYVDGGPLWKADMNRDGSLSPVDQVWFQAHRNCCGEKRGGK